MKKQWKELMIKQIKIEFIFGRIAEKENITISDDDFKSFVDYLVSSGNSQMADENAVYKYYGINYLNGFLPRNHGKAFLAD